MSSCLKRMDGLIFLKIKVFGQNSPINYYLVKYMINNQ